MSDVTSCLESQGCRLISHSYLLSCLFVVVVVVIWFGFGFWGLFFVLFLFGLVIGLFFSLVIFVCLFSFGYVS